MTGRIGTESRCPYADRPAKPVRTATKGPPRGAAGVGWPCCRSCALTNLPLGGHRDRRQCRPRRCATRTESRPTLTTPNEDCWAMRLYRSRHGGIRAFGRRLVVRRHGLGESSALTAAVHTGSQIVVAAVRVGDVDGHGLFGVLDETDAGLLCHDCGWRGQHLGLHVYRAHGLTASAYRIAHGLKRRRGLVGAATRVVITENATLRYASPAGTAFRRARDPAGAALVRLAQALPASAEAAAARDVAVARVGRSTRVPRVVTCGWCDAQFCPLRSAKRRRFCSRSCAGRQTRALEAAPCPTSSF
jgi:hypothetical protein